MPVDISRFGCYPHSITNAMTQSSKQGDALREVPGGARHSAIQLPNWLYSGCVEPPSKRRRALPLQCRNMMVFR